MKFITSKHGQLMMILIYGFKLNFIYKSVQTNITKYRCFVKTRTATIHMHDNNNVLNIIRSILIICI